MKLKKLTLIITLLATPFAFAADEHDHSNESKEESHKHEENVNKGPNGCRRLSKSGFNCLSKSGQRFLIFRAA